MINCLYLGISDTNLDAKHRIYFNAGKIEYVPMEFIKIFKRRNSLEQWVKKEVLLGGKPKAWGLDLYENKIIPLTVEIVERK